MTLYQFNRLSENEQAQMIWEYGAHLADRVEGDFKLLLYQIDSFYTEVWYDAIGNVIQRIRAFRNTTPLEPYLEQINIPF